ncbi:hypothetical protein NY78_0702 [Desulfovibrio sp. TomC]|nr:hypothetical protein NY78_0702 [Desulfovibrio sp. TomC]
MPPEHFPENGVIVGDKDARHNSRHSFGGLWPARSLCPSGFPKGYLSLWPQEQRGSASSACFDCPGQKPPGLAAQRQEPLEKRFPLQGSGGSSPRPPEASSAFPTLPPYLGRRT